MTGGIRGQLGMGDRDYSPKSSPNQIRDFMESSVYKDFVSEMYLRIEDLRDALEGADSKLFNKTQGAVLFARLTLDIFKDLERNSLEDSTESERGE